MDYSAMIRIPRLHCSPVAGTRILQTVFIVSAPSILGAAFRLPLRTILMRQARSGGLSRSGLGNSTSARQN